MSSKVMLVDDDLVSRTNLKTMIHWEKHCFSLCCEAINGYEAIQMIEIHLPDIVITDMNMPVMDGIALIEHIEQNHPGIKIIALSGYDEFDYVRQSLKKGAIDYILKHKLNSDTLLNVLNIAQQEIQKDKQMTEQNLKQQEQIVQGKTAIIQKFVSKLISGQILEADKIQETLTFLNINFGMRNIVAIAAEIEDAKKYAELYITK